MTNFLPRMHTHYNSIVCQDIIYTHGIQNIMQLPRITQCALNSTATPEGILAIQTALQSIGGQKERSTLARKSIAAFQIRKKTRLGCATNLRRERLYSFLDYFVSIYLPSTARKGVQRKEIKRTCSFGVQDFTFFPELQPHFMALSNAGGCGCEFCVRGAGTAILKQIKSTTFNCVSPPQPKTQSIVPTPCSPRGETDKSGHWVIKESPTLPAARQPLRRKHSINCVDNSSLLESTSLLTAFQLAIKL